MRTFLFTSARRTGTDQFKRYAEKRGVAILTIPALSRLVSTIYVAVRGTLHSLRHHFISHLVNNLREPITVAAQLAGHTKIETTMKYTHVMSNYAIRAMARFSLYEN
jgi:integrase